MALAVFPTLSGQAAENNLLAMRRTMNQSLRNILFLTVPASALMFLLAEPVITFLLESGKYTHNDTLVTASALRFLSLGIFAWSCQSLLTRGFYALQNSKVPVISGAIVSVLFVAMNAYVVRPVIQVKARVAALTTQVQARQNTLDAVHPLVKPAADAQNQLAAGLSSVRPSPDGLPSNLGQAQDKLTQLVSQINATDTEAQARHDQAEAALWQAQSELKARAATAVKGLGLATTIAATVHMLALFFLLRHRLTGLQTRRLLISVAKIIFATAVLCIVTLVLRRVGGAITLTLLEMPRFALLSPKVGAAIVLALAGVGGIGSYLFAARLLRLSELQSAIDLIRRRKRG